MLHQIIALKSLGFSLDDIKNRLIPLETPNDVATALTEQADSIREKIEQLTASLTAIEQLKKEVLQMQTVNFAYLFRTCYNVPFGICSFDDYLCCNRAACPCSI